MPGGFLLDEDARDARLNSFDSWLDDQRKAVTQTAGDAAQSVTQAVQAAPSAAQQAQQAAQQRFDQWFAEQQAALAQSQKQAEDQAAQQAAAQQATQPAQPTPPVAQAPAPTPAPIPDQTTAPEQPAVPLSDAQQSAGQRFDTWLEQQRAGLTSSPVGQAAGGAANAAGTAASSVLPHQEEPATSTDTVTSATPVGGPDLGKNWKTQFDFGAVYTGDYRTGTPHRGVDMVPTSGKGIGTEVDAFEPGTVTNIFRDPGGAGGLIVYVQDSDGLTHAYMHLAGTQPGLSVGTQVQRGTPIAMMGESGTEGSPHLHYEVRKNASNGDPLNQLIDPRPYVSGEKQPGGQTAATQQGATQQTSNASAGAAPSNAIDSSSPTAFAKSAAPYAQYAAQKLGLDPTWVVAMMASESNYGKADAAGHELFGVKALPGQPHTTLATHEGEFGGTNMNQDFASYDSALDSVNAWVDLISKHYPGAVNAKDLPTFVHGLKQGGYFTANEGEYLGNVGSIASNLGSAVQEGLGAAGSAVGAAAGTVGGAVGAAASATGTAARQALDAATAGSAAARQQAENLVNQGRTQLQQLQDQTAQLQKQLDDSRARLQAAQDDAAKQAQQFTSNIQQNYLQPRDFSGITNQAAQIGQDVMNSGPAQAAGRAVGSAFDQAPSPAGSTFGNLRQDIQNAPENLRNLGTGLANVPAVAEREANQDNQLTQGVNTVQQLVTGRELSPEARQLVNQAAPPMLSSAHAGGVVSQFLKDAQILPASQTITLPTSIGQQIGPIPIADLIGLAADTIMPMGAEERFAATAEQRLLNRAAFEVAQRAGAGTGGFLERGGTQAAWAAALGNKTGAAGLAARTAMSGVGKWARSSVSQIVEDLAKGPVGDLARDESGQLDVGKLTQIATRVKEEMVRVYSGTVGEYDRADLGRANPEGLYGPGYYTTDNPQIAGGRVAVGGEQYEGPTIGPVSAAEREAMGTFARDPGEVIEPGYAQAAADRAGLPMDERTFTDRQNNLERTQQQLAEVQRSIAIEPFDREKQRLQKQAQDLQGSIDFQRELQQRDLNMPAGPAVRPLDVPKSLNLFNMDAPVAKAELNRLADVAASKGMGQTERVFGNAATRADNLAKPYGQDIYENLQGDAGLSKAQINDFLESAGYHGITHPGGAIRPMMDEAGQPIQHQTRVLFQSGLDRSRTLAGTQAGAIPNAAIGGAAGSQTGEEDQSPQERLYRGAGGAFVAGLARKNPAVAAFEAQALRKGATYRDIADAVQRAREVAGKVNKFAGPIADATEAAFNKAPGADQVLAARQMLKDFGDKASLAKAAPPNAQTDSGAARLHNFLTELAQQGASQRHWYTDASQAILEATGGDKQRAEKLAQLFAIYSPGATVSANTQMALAAWHQFLEGVPIAVGKTDLDKKAQALLYDNKPWDGRKTNNFYRNLMKRIDPEVWASMGKEDGQTGTTVDIWMMRAMRYLQDAPSMGPKGQYEFAQRAIERVAKDLGWQPDEAQAAIWSAYKAATEGSELTEAGYHYGTGLAERSGRVGELPGQAPEAVANARDDLQRVFGLFGQEGAPALPAEKGSRTLYNPDGTPVYNPKKLAQGTKEALSENIPEARGAISAAASKTVSAYAAARAWLEKLPEISWARVFPDNKPTLRDANALVANVGRPLTDDEISKLQSQLGPNISITPTKDGAWIINHDGQHVREPNVPGGPPEDNLAGQWVGSNNRDFHKSADAALRSLDTVEEASTYPLRADTTTLTNDWSTSPNGEDYAHVINGSARAGAFWDVADPLAKRVADATGGDAEHAAAIPDLRAAAEPSPDIPGRVPGAADYGTAADTAATEIPGDTGAAAGAAAPEAGAATNGPVTDTTTPGPRNAVRDFLTGEGSERGSISLGTMSRLGGAGAGVAGSEATMSDEDKQDPFGRFSRDVGAAILGSAAPGAARAIARGGGVGYQDLKAVRPGVGAPKAAPAQNFAQNFSAYTKQNLLSGAKTSVTNIVSQLVELAHQPLSAIASGHEEDAFAGLKASAQSVPDALQNFARTLSTGETQFTQSQGATPRWLPALRLLSATDDFFRTMGWAMGAGMEGQRILRESGATASTASSILGSNSARISAAGDKAGALSVFGEGKGAGNAFSQWKNKMLSSTSKTDQMYGLLADAGIPFAAVPGRIWNTGIKRVPGVGEVLALRRAGIAIKAGDSYAFQKAMGDVAIQSVISASILSNVAKGNIRGPDDQEHPNGVKLNGQWYDYSGWGAWMLPMSIPAALVEATRKTGNKPNADLTTYANAWGNSIMKTTANQFYSADLVKTLNQVGEGNGMGALNQVALGYADRVLPGSAALNNATQLFDPVLRDPTDKGMQAFIERWQSKIPGLESKLPATPNMLTGEPQQRTSAGPGQLIGMTTRPPDKLSTTISALERQGYSIPDPKKAPTEVTLEGSTIPLTEAEGRALAVKRGQLIDRVVGSYVNSSGFDAMSPNQQAQAIQARIADIDNDTATNWAQMTPAADRSARIAANRTFVGRLEPVGSGVGR